MRNIAKVTYVDGTSNEAPLTPRVITSCEEHAQKEGWAAGEGSRIRQSYYMAYLAMRFAGNTSKPYDQWLDDVDDIDVETPENPTEEPRGPTIRSACSASSSPTASAARRGHGATRPANWTGAPR